MIVDGTAHPDLPANRQQFVQIGFVNQIAGIVLRIPEQVGLQRFGIDRILPQILQRAADASEVVLPELAQTVDEVLQWGP